MFKVKIWGIAVLALGITSLAFAAADIASAPVTEPALSSSTFVFNARNVPDIVQALNFAQKNHKNLTIEDGQVAVKAPGVVYLDLQGFDQMVSLQLQRQSIVVQAGMTWGQVQRLVAPFGLTPQFMPAQANEAIVETINSNRPGLTPSSPWVSEGLTSIRLLQSDGKIVNASQEKTPELWQGLIGGQGLLGVPLDVEVSLVKNQNLLRHAKLMSYRDYPAYIQDQVQGNSDISASFARVDVAPGKDFLNQLYVVSYWVKNKSLAEAVQVHPIRNDLTHSLYQWSAQGDDEKSLRWQMEKGFLANDLLHSSLTRSDLLMRQTKANRAAQTQALYYIPADQFVAFMDDLRALSIEQKRSFNQVTVRFLPKPSQSILALQKQALFATTLTFQSKADTADNDAIFLNRLNSIALNRQGGFALNANTLTDSAQMQALYPRLAEFLKLKSQYDTENMLISAQAPTLNREV